MRVVVMGVSGSGKSTVGRELAAALGADFVDADDLHPEANIAKMRAGIPLDDADRWPWLAAVGRVLAADGARVVACSALKRAYRDVIRAAAGDAVFVHLVGSAEQLAARMAEREHFMPVSLLGSQLAALEPLQPDEPGVEIPLDLTVAEAVATARDAMRQWAGMRAIQDSGFASGSKPNRA